MGKRKQQPLPLRTLRMNRAGRLQSARHWLATQKSRTPVQIAKSYRKRYGVDWQCAIRELGVLGVRLDAAWMEQLQRILEGARRTHRQRREAKEASVSGDPADSNETFAYIAGYTPNGLPFGVTWEEWRELEQEKRGADAEPECPF